MRREEKRRREKLKVHICKYIEVESSSNNKQKITFESYLYSALTSLKPGNNIVREESDGRSIKRRTVPGEKREEERRRREKKKKKREERAAQKPKASWADDEKEEIQKKKKFVPTLSRTSISFVCRSTSCAWAITLVVRVDFQHFKLSVLVVGKRRTWNNKFGMFGSISCAWKNDIYNI